MIGQIPRSAIWLIAFCALASVPNAAAQSDPRNYVGQTSVVKAHTVLLVKIETLASGQGSCSQPNNGRGTLCRRAGVRVVRVLKDADHQGLVPDLFQVDILQRLSGTAGWSPVLVEEPSHEYVLLSDLKGGSTAALESPARVLPVADGEEPAADIEFVIASASVPVAIREQVSAAAGMIRNATRVHTMFMAEYIERLIDSSLDPDVADLVPAVEGRQGPVFSNAGARLFLGHQWLLVQGREHPPVNALRLFVAVTVRSLEEQSRDVTVPDVREDVVGTFVPWILGSEPAMAAFRATMTPQFAERFRKAVRQLAADDGKFSPQQRANLLRLLAAAGPG